MTDETWLVEFHGPPARAGQLAQMLNEAGAQTEWEPPYERRDGVVATVVVTIIATALYDAVKSGVDRFLERCPAASVFVKSPDLQDGEVACEWCHLPIRGPMVQATTVHPYDIVQGHGVGFHPPCYLVVRESPRYDFTKSWYHPDVE